MGLAERFRQQVLGLSLSASLVIPSLIQGTQGVTAVSAHATNDASAEAPSKSQQNPESTNRERRTIIWADLQVSSTGSAPRPVLNVQGFEIEVLAPGPNVDKRSIQTGVPDNYADFDTATGSENLRIDEQTRSAIQQIRDLTDLSWARIADLLGVRRQTIIRWRQGSSAPRTANFQHAQEVLKVFQEASKHHGHDRRLARWLDRRDPQEESTPFEHLKQNRFDDAWVLAATPRSTVKVLPAMDRDWSRWRELADEDEHTYVD